LHLIGETFRVFRPAPTADCSAALVAFAKGGYGVAVEEVVSFKVEGMTCASMRFPARRESALPEGAWRLVGVGELGDGGVHGWGVPPCPYRCSAVQTAGYDATDAQTA
jgi:hypothetical protein